MDQYVTGDVIRRLREARKLTQEELAGRLHVSGKAVSRWETGRGYPDISLLETLAGALGISVIELLSGQAIRNVCPVCCNVVLTAGEAVISCCGITLPPLEPEAADEDHAIRTEISEDEYYVSLRHPMTREHHISFLAAVSDRRVELVKLYPEENAEARFQRGHAAVLYACCNRHGLFRAAP